MEAKKSERELIASRCALEFKDGDYVNLGIGIPDYSANFIPDGMNVLVHSENGLLGMGPDPTEEEEDADLLNASKGPVTYMKGSSVFSSSDSFAIIRGGHLDISILGALQVSQSGDLANWCIPNKMMKGIGGAMDLVAGCKRIIVATTHVTRDGKPKIMKQCSLPLTGTRVASMIVTDLAVFQVKKDGSGLLLTEYAPHTTVEEIRAKTEADFEVSPTLKHIEYSPMNATHAAALAKPKEAPPAPAADEPKDLAGMFEILKKHKDFATLKGVLKGSMGSMMLPTVLPMIAKQSPALAAAIKADKKAFLKMINES
jgi:3-oxoacid CoA-transferase subunit B